MRRDGPKVLLGLKNMGGESTAAWQAFLEDMSKRGLTAPDFVIVDGAPGLEAALAALWPDAPVQRCTVHKHRNLLGHAPKRLHDELTEDYRDMIYADTTIGIETRRKAFIRKWRLKCRAVADSLEEAGDRLFTFTRLPPSQWKSARTTDVIDKTLVRGSAILPSCGRPRGEAWRVGWKRHRAACSVPAGLRRPHTHSVLEGCGRQAATKCS